MIAKTLIVDGRTLLKRKHTAWKAVGGDGNTAGKAPEFACGNLPNSPSITVFLKSAKYIHVKNSYM
jgi:hypothetical protein